MKTFALFSAESKLMHEKEIEVCITLGTGQSASAPNYEESTRYQVPEAKLEGCQNRAMKVYNKTTGRFYVGFSSKLNLPLWSSPHRPSQAAFLSPEFAEAVVRQLTSLEPSLDLQIVD